MKRRGSHRDTEERGGAPRSDPESAHSAFLEAGRLLRDQTAGTPVLELEWAVIQGLCRDAAQLFDDLPLVLGQPRPVELPRRWWQRRGAVEMVDQKYLTAQILAHAGDPKPLLEMVTFMLGRDAVLRVDMTFIPAEWARATLRPGWLAPDDARMQQLFGWHAGHNAWPLLLNEVELGEAEHILTAFERLAVLTRDRVAARLQRLHDREHL